MKSLLSHRLIDPGYAELFDAISDELIKRIDPAREPARKSKSSTQTPPAESARTAQAEGTIATSLHDGEDTVENLQLVCRAHNIHRACEKLGVDVMKPYLSGLN